MPPLRLGGLSSGLDTETIIAQLMAAERGPRIRYERQQDVAEARKSTLADIQSKLKALGTALADLRSPTLFADTQTVETSDASRVAVSRTGSVGTGAYMVKVTTVAAAEQRSFTYTPQASASSVDVGGHSTTLAAAATLEDAIAAINADGDAKVWASNVSGKLALTWRDTGAGANGQVVTGAALSGEAMIRAGRNAAFEIDGVAGTSSTNEITTLPGLTLTLKAPTTADVAITVGPPGPDTEKVTGKLKAFVEAYNAANDLIRNELREERVRNANSKFDRGKGVLRNDPALAQLQSQLRQVLSTTIGTGNTAADQLADLGITTGAAAGEASFSRDAINGRLVIDEEKMKATLLAQPTAVKQLLGATGGAGIAQAMEAILAPVTGTGGTFDQRATSADSEIKRLKDAMTAFDQRLELRERALRSMFSRLEQGLAASQAQGSMLTQRLAASSNG